ncbi:hypothetical protein [Caulobacter sp. 1776]|uniref:hypothetical protein n=1 Tax=Caulobacter sp. 1776 TaxID=3156420 RepID=UPI00339138D9
MRRIKIGQRVHEIEAIDYFVGKVIPTFFEFMKRVAIVAVLKVGSEHSAVMTWLYWLGLGALTFPVFAWMEKRSFTLLVEGDIDPRASRAIETAWFIVVSIASVGLVVLINTVLTAAVNRMPH